MADGVNILDASDASIEVATDDCGESGHAQLVKLAYSADGVATAITADSDGLEVKVSNISTLYQYNDGDANTSAYGILVQGDDSSNLQNIRTDSDGHLQIDVLSGAGTQYTEADTDASITGTAILWEDTSDTLRAVSAAKPLPVSDAGGALTVDGSVTANAGTNLNTSTLALEAGGNLAAAATSLGNLDNAVDGNYLNVNLNVAGTDVASNAGVLNAQTVRVTIATDDEVNNFLGTIDADTSTLAGAIAGTEMQVDVVSSALPSGAATAAKQPALGTAGTPSADVISVQGVASGTVIPVSDGDGALTVDGTVTANLSATDNAVLDDIAANQTDASQKTQIVDGSGNVIGATSNALDVNIKSGSSAGTEYTEGATDATITGAAVLWEDADDTLRVPSASKPLPVNVVAGGAGNGSILDGANTEIKATVLDYTNSNPLAVRLTNTDGDYVAAGAGTQYTEGDTDASITGTAILWEDGSDTLRAVSAAKPLPISDAGGALTVDGTVAVTNADLSTIAGDTTSIDGKITACNTGAVVLAAGSAEIGKLAAGTANIGKLTDDQKVDVNKMGGAAVPIGAGTEAAAIRVTVATDSTGVLSIDDNGGALTVDGTVTANAGTNLNTSALALETGGNLAAAATSLGNIDNAVDGNYLNVNMNVAGTDVASNAGVLNAQTMRVTIATDDECNNLLGTIDADTSSLAGCVGGTELQVDIVGALPAGTAAIGKLAANSGVDIGDVDVTSIVPGVAATNLGKAEDAGHSSGDVGVMALGVRNDNGATSFGANADYTPIGVSANGGVFVNLGDVHTRTRVSTQVVYSASQTAQTLWDPAAGKKFCVTHITVSASGAGAVTIFDSTDSASTCLVELNLAANGGWDADFASMHWISATADNILKYTTGSGAAGTITVHGYEVG